MKSKHVFHLAAAAALAALTAPAAFAQAAPVSRESVKAETKAAAAAGTLMPAGQGAGTKGSGDTGRSNKTRAERKSETIMERDMGGLTPAGQVSAKPDHMNKVHGHPKKRATVKGQTRAAARAGSLQPAGEAPQPSSDTQKK